MAEASVMPRSHCGRDLVAASSLGLFFWHMLAVIFVGQYVKKQYLVWTNVTDVS